MPSIRVVFVAKKGRPMTLIEFIRASVWRAASGGPYRWKAAQPKIDALYRWTMRPLRHHHNGESG